MLKSPALASALAQTRVIIGRMDLTNPAISNRRLYCRLPILGIILAKDELTFLAHAPSDSGSSTCNRSLPSGIQWSTLKRLNNFQAVFWQYCLFLPLLIPTASVFSCFDGMNGFTSIKFYVLGVLRFDSRDSNTESWGMTAVTTHFYDRSFVSNQRSLSGR